MSLMIKGINLPKKGDVICLEIYSDGSVWDKSNWEPHPPKVSAIQIPKDHGRIVELKDIRYCALSSDGKSRELEFLLATQVEALPTILEEGEE